MAAPFQILAKLRFITIFPYLLNYSLSSFDTLKPENRVNNIHYATITQRMYCISTAKTNEFMPFREIIVVCSKNYIKIHQYSV
jgi:hypothetical protein